MSDHLFCDNCGMQIFSTNSYIWAELPCDIDSANAGESAVVCHSCYEKIKHRRGGKTMNDPFELAHNLAKSLAPFNHLVVVATDQAYLIGHLQDEVKQLREERDEARRDACKFAAVTELGSRAYARNRGWDCFKEEPRWNSDPNIISLDELARCTRNQTP